MERPGSLPEIAIERAEAADADAVLKLCYLAYQSEAQLYDDWTIPPLRETYADVLRALQDAVILIARRDGEVVGSVRGRDAGGATVDVGRLVVHPRLQRRGLGTRLLLAIEEPFPDATCFELFTGHRSADNLRLYARHGYRETRRETVSRALTMIFMQKRRR